MEDILKRALKQAKEAEVFYTQIDLNEIKFENNNLKYVKSKNTGGVGLRVINEGKIGFSSTTNLSAIDKLVESALISAKFGQEARFTLPDTAILNKVKIFDPEVEDFSIEDGVSLGYDAISQVLKINPEIYCWANINSSVSKTRLINSKGMDIEYPKTHFSFYTGGLLVRKNSLLEIYDGQGSSKLIRDISPFISKISQSYDWSKKELQINTNRMPVIFTTKAMACLLEIIELGVNGKMVQKGVSPLTGRIGSQIFESQITIYDDPTIDFGPNSTPIDDEGITTNKMTLIESGVLKGYLLDLQTAGMMGVQSIKTNGHGFRTFDALPSPQCTNLVLESGHKRFEDMVSGMKNGLIVDIVLGGGQSNILAGEFSLNIGLGFKVENGQIVGRVKDAMVSGNLFDVLSAQVELGLDAEFWQAIKTPSVLFESLPVTGR